MDDEKKAKSATDNANDGRPPAEVAKTDSSSPPNQQKKTESYFQKTKQFVWRLTGRRIVFIANALRPYDGLLTALATITLAVLTYFLAVYANDLGTISGKQLKVLRDQQKTMQGQLNEMQAERRPWLSIDPKDRASPAEPLEFDANGVPHMGMKLTLKNSGDEPALEVKWLDEIIDASRSNHDAMMEPSQQKRLCEELQRRGAGIVTFSLFPGNTQNVAFHGVAANPKDVLENRFSRKKELNLQYFGCVRYRDGSGPWRHTSYIFDLAYCPPLMPGACDGVIRPIGKHPEIELLYLGQSAD